MKEICAIIRRDKLQETKHAIAEAGYPSVSIQSVEGRGKQKGDVACSLSDMDQDGLSCNSTHIKLYPTPSTYALTHTLPTRWRQGTTGPCTATPSSGKRCLRSRRAWCR